MWVNTHRSMLGGMKGDSDPKGRILGWAHVVDCDIVQKTRGPDDGTGLLKEILGTELYPKPRSPTLLLLLILMLCCKQEHQGTLGN